MEAWIDVLDVVSTIIGLIVAIPTFYSIGKTLYNRSCYVRRRRHQRRQAPAPVRCPATAMRLFNPFTRCSIWRTI